MISGFTIGIAIIIATSQLKDALGLQAEAVPAEFIGKIEALWAARATVSPAAVLVVLLTVGLIVLLRRVAPRWPGLILAVGVASALVPLLNLDVGTIQSRFGGLPSSLPAPRLPTLTVARIQELLPSAFVIAFLAGIESLLSATVADRMVGGRHRPNAEVMAQGIANLGSSLFAGLPATGAIARTATNVRAGGKTPVAGIVHALTILLALLFAAPLAGHLAMPALAGLLLVTAWNMSEPNKWREYLTARRSDQGLIAMTLLLTVFVDLTFAIGAGVAAGLSVRIRRQSVKPAEWTIGSEYVEELRELAQASPPGGGDAGGPDDDQAMSR